MHLQHVLLTIYDILCLSRIKRPCLTFSDVASSETEPLDLSINPLGTQISSTVSARHISSQSAISISITTQWDPAISAATSTTDVSDQVARSTSSSTSYTEEESQIESNIPYVVHTETSETVSVLPVSAGSSASDTEMFSEPDVIYTSSHEPPASESQDSVSARYSSEIQPSEIFTSESEMSTSPVISEFRFKVSTFLDVLPSGDGSDSMDSESVSPSLRDSTFSRLSSSLTTQSGEFTTQTSEATSIGVAASASIASSDAFSIQSHTTTALPLGAVSSTGADSMDSESFSISPFEANTAVFHEEHSSSADGASYLSSLETTTVEPTVFASSSVTRDSHFVSDTTSTAFVSDTVALSVTGSNSNVIPTQDFAASEMPSIDPTSAVYTSMNTWVESSGDGIEMWSPSQKLIISSQFESAVTSDMLYSADISSTLDAALSTETIILPSKRDDLASSVAISTTEGDVTSVRTTVDVTTQVTTTTETETTSTELISTTTAPSDLEVLLIMEGDCDFVVATSENKQVFTKKIEVKTSYFIT